jgi:DNA topoisomerase IA
MVVDRFKEIENFTQPYWELQTLYRETCLIMRWSISKKRRRTNFSQSNSEFEIVSVEKNGK